MTLRSFSRPRSVRGALWLAIALATLGCGTQPPPFANEDSGGSVTQAEAGGSGDDSGVAEDSSTFVLPDGSPTVPTDASAEGGPTVTDGGTAADATITGMSWPTGQVFPSFAPIGTLDVVDQSSLDAGSVTLATSLQGIVNRTQPRIYVTGSGEVWLPQLDASTNTVADPLTLVTKYASEISGIVIYDETLMDTLNLATTIAGVEGAIISSPELAPTLTSAPYSLPVIADLRTNHFATNLDVYQYELDNYASKTTHRLIVGLEPTFDGQLRDYAIATQAMVTWLDPTVTAQATLLGQFLALLSPTSPYVGWTPNEPAGVSEAANYGVPVFAADWSTNLTVLGGTPRGSTPPPIPPTPALLNKVYIAVFMSDGDNLQEDEGLIPLKWSDSARGSVPISWTIDPALVDVAPIILRYFERTATVNDLLVSGPSGLGYTYPAAWPSTSTFNEYAQVSGGYMSAAGLTIATLWNNGANLSAANATSYATNIPNLIGLTMQSSTTALEFIGANNVPVAEMSVSYASDATDLENGIDAVVATYDRAAPVFAAVQGDMNEGPINPSAFASVLHNYGLNTNVEFVRADHFFELMQRATYPAAHKIWSGDFNGDGFADSLFYYSGNGDFWVGLSNGTALTWTHAGNVASQFTSYGNLLSASFAFYVGKFSGGAADDLMFYSASDGTWWLGAVNATTLALTWTNVSTDPGAGNLLNGQFDVRLGDYNLDGKTDVAWYDAAGAWSIGISSGTALTWSNAGDTSGFGNLLDGSHVMYDGDFNGDGMSDVLFYYNAGAGAFWQGDSSGTAFTWVNAGSTSFGNLVDGGHHMVAGRFTSDAMTDLLFYYNGDGSWWLGTSTGSGFNWSNAGKSPTTTNLVDWNHRIYTADMNGDGITDVVLYDAATGDWTVGICNGTTLTWSGAGSSSSVGNPLGPTGLLWFGDYTSKTKAAPMFYDSKENNWWMASLNGATFTWSLAASTSGFGNLAQ